MFDIKNSIFCIRKLFLKSEIPLFISDFFNIRNEIMISKTIKKKIPQKYVNIVLIMTEQFQSIKRKLHFFSYFTQIGFNIVSYCFQEKQR